MNNETEKNAEYSEEPAITDERSKQLAEEFSEEIANTRHLELIIKDGIVTIPSIFLFKQTDDVTAFLARAREAGCTVFFQNEDLTVSPTAPEPAVLEKVNLFASLVSHREIGNAYARFIWNIDKMSWDKAQSIEEIKWL